MVRFAIASTLAPTPTMTMNSSFSLLVFALLGQTPQTIKVEESFRPGYLYHVSCRVGISGTLQVPGDKGPAKPLALSGASVIDYDERVLTEKDGRVEKTIRVFQKMNFERKVGDQEQHSALRPEVRRLVLLRHGNLEVPFSPAGSPLTWSELDLVRTDVFTPALVGLLPPTAVKLGDRWQAGNGAVQELTDLEKIDDGDITCSFEGTSTLAGKQQARIGFAGTLRGVGEDGPTRHQIEGHLFFDLTGKYLSYVYVKGTHFLLDKSGQPNGKVEGTFVLTREPVAQAHGLGDADLRGLMLEPNEDNTLLLLDQPDLGVRLLYPRRWRVGSVQGRQITLDENRGNGLLLNVESLARTPSGVQFQQETRAWLDQQKANILRADPPKFLAGGIEHFAFEAHLAKSRQLLDYYVLRQPLGGVTIAVRLVPADAAAVRKDVERIVGSLRVTKQQ